MEFSRRKFIKSTTLGGVGVAFAPEMLAKETKFNDSHCVPNHFARNKSLAMSDDVRAFLKTINSQPQLIDTSLSASEIRENLKSFNSEGNLNLKEMFKISNYSIDAGGFQLSLRHYVPHKKTDSVMIFFHGGGWTLGNLDSYETVCRDLAHFSGISILSVDYRLAPENPYPGALLDAEAVTKWVEKNANRLGVNLKKIGVGGDSAGGTLAALCAQNLHKWVDFKFCHQMLYYPVSGLNFDTYSMNEYAEGYLLTRELMKWFTFQFLPNGTDGVTFPVDGDVSHCAPATIMTAGYDPLQDEIFDYHIKLVKFGIPSQHKHCAGLIHNFISLHNKLNSGQAELEWSCEEFKRYYQ